MGVGEKKEIPKAGESGDGEAGGEGKACRSGVLGWPVCSWGEEEGKQIPKRGGRAAVLGEGEEKVKLFRVFFFVLPPPLIAKLPPSVLSCGPIFIGKMLFGPQT